MSADDRDYAEEAANHADMVAEQEAELIGDAFERAAPAGFHVKSVTRRLDDAGAVTRIDVVMLPDC